MRPTTTVNSVLTLPPVASYRIVSYRIVPYSSVGPLDRNITTYHSSQHLLSLGLQETASLDSLAMASIVIFASVGGLVAFLLGRKFYRCVLFRRCSTASSLSDSQNHATLNRHYVPSWTAMKNVMERWGRDLLGLPWSRDSFSISSFRRNCCYCCCCGGGSSRGDSAGDGAEKTKAERRKERQKKKKKKKRFSGKALDPVREGNASARARNRAATIGFRRRANTTTAAAAALGSPTSSGSGGTSSPDPFSREGRERAGQIELTTVAGGAVGTGNGFVGGGISGENNTNTLSSGAHLLSPPPGPVAVAAAASVAAKKYLDQTNARIALCVW